MNKFDQVFFKKYVAEGVQIKEIIHEHIIIIIDKIILNYFFGVLLPTFLYFYSDLFKQIIPFFVLEGFLLIMFLKILYDVFDWYCDVWIVTNDGVVELDWSLFSTNSTSVKYSSIEGLEVVQDGIIDTLLVKGDLIIHKIGGGEGGSFRLNEASRPYESIDIIEKYSSGIKRDTDEESNQQESNDEYNIIIESLSQVVKDYLRNNNKKEENKKEYIEKVKNKAGTIDIR